MSPWRAGAPYNFLQSHARIQRSIGILEIMRMLAAHGADLFLV